MNGLKEARTCGGGGGVCVSLGEEGQTHLSLKWTVHNVVGNKNIPTDGVVQRYYMEEVSCSDSVKLLKIGLVRIFQVNDLGC